MNTFSIVSHTSNIFLLLYFDEKGIFLDSTYQHNLLKPKSSRNTLTFMFANAIYHLFGNQLTYPHLFLLPCMYVHFILILLAIVSLIDPINLLSNPDQYTMLF